jgi:polysaccharide export outer membrane protein
MENLGVVARSARRTEPLVHAGTVRRLVLTGLVAGLGVQACAAQAPPEVPGPGTSATASPQESTSTKNAPPGEPETIQGGRQVGARISTYYLSSGDEIRISVYGYPQLARTARIPPDGHLFYPTLGDVDVDGMSIPELRDMITERLRTAEEQRIVTGDEIAVRVYRNDDVNTTAVVSSSGRVSLPLAGEVAVVGLTVEGASRAIAEKLSPYIVRPSVSTTIQKSVAGLPGPVTDPHVSVEVTDFGGHKVVVLGAVAHPGVYVSEGGSRLVEMVARAGGPTADAKLARVALVRPATETAQQLTAVVDLNRAIKGGDLTQNPPVQRGDVIYVPARTFATLAQFFDYVFRIVRPFAVVAYPTRVVFQ